jgi:hypothetical protein
VVTALLPAAWVAWPRSAIDQSLTLLKGGRPAEALALVDATLPGASRSEAVRVWPLKAAALHQLGRTSDEKALIRSMPYQVLFVAPLPLLEALAEDAAAAAEADPELEDWLTLIPARERDAAFASFARGPLGPRQWGALRWLDRAGHVAPGELASRYAASLRSTDCAVRQKAARRLGELGERSVIEALRELSETPKDERPTGTLNCGQDEAAEAIRALKKRC